MEKLTSIEKISGIDEIESSIIPTGKKIDLALLLLGKKEATQLGNFKIPASDQERKSIIEEFDEEFQTVIELIDRLRLPFYIKQRPNEADDIIGFSILVSKNEEDLARFVEADTNSDDTTFGLMVGYPKTAVEAYRTKEAFDYETELPEDQSNALAHEEGLKPFLHFMSSREHWLEELAFARNNRDLIKEKAPKLYQEIIHSSE